MLRSTLLAHPLRRTFTSTPFRATLDGSRLLMENLTRMAAADSPEVLHVPTANIIPLPPAPPYPCPHLQAFNVLAPLYKHQWRVIPSPTARTLSLRKLYHFKTIGGMVRFFNTVMSTKDGVCFKEGHHPFSIRTTNKSILICLRTHEALPDPSEIPATASESLLKPGLTLRDVRLAILIERVFEDKFLTGKSPSGRYVSLNDRGMFQPVSMDDVVWGATGKGSRVVFEDDVDEDEEKAKALQGLVQETTQKE